MQIDWQALTQRAIDVLPHSYSPYSEFPVAAAAICDDGRIITGVNVENASYGLGCIAVGARGRCLHLRLRDRSSMR